MSQRIRQFDWAKHPLGPLAQWPAALRIAMELLLATQFGACLLWGKGLYAIYNDAFLRTLGDKPEALGRPFSDIWREAWSTIRPFVERAFAGEVVAIQDYPFEINRYGRSEIAYFTCCASPVRDEHGMVVGMFCTVIETTAKMAADSLAHNSALNLDQRATERSADRDRLWMRSDALLMVARFDGTIVAVNPAWTSVLGWSEPEIVGRSLLSFAHPDDLALATQELEALAQGTPRLSGSLRYCRIDGALRWISWSAVSSEGFIQAVGRDVTDERAQADALRSAEAQFRQSQKMESLGQLTGGIAHDFNNMLQGIVLPLQFIRQRMQQQRYDEVGRYVEAGLASAKRAAALTQRLLAFSRRQPLDSKPMDLAVAFDGLQALLKTSCGENITVMVNVPPSVWNVFTDAHQFDNAIVNLVINARDAMPGGGRVRITARNLSFEQLLPPNGLTPGDYVLVSVEDTGIGMSAKVVERAFDPFFTTKPFGRGTGLGLSMVYGYMRQTGGAAVIESTEGCGTAVQLYFRRAEGCVESESSAQLIQESGIKRGDMVLIAEDDVMIREMVAELLKDMGFQIRLVSTGNEAMTLLSGALHFDLLVSDVGLPGPNGRQVADYAREMLPDIRVLLMTGYAEQAVMNSRFLGPAMELLVKPFDAHALVAKVQAIMRHVPG